MVYTRLICLLIAFTFLVSPLSAERSVRGSRRPRSGPPAPSPKISGDVLFEWHGSNADEARRYNKWAAESTSRGRDGFRTRFIFRNGSTVTTNEDVDPPIILSDGKTFEARTTKNTRDKKGHTDFKIYNKSNLIGGTFCQMDRTYNIQFKARLVSIRKAQTNESFIIGVQFWGHSYLDHSGSKSPPLVWMTDDMKWEVFSYGAPRPSSQSKWFRSNAILGPPDDGWHEWRITYRPSLSNGLVVIYRDGIRRDVAIGKPTAIFASSGGKPMPGPLLRVGVYSSKSSEHSIIQYRDIVYTVD
jgi:hypothetical protein